MNKDTAKVPSTTGADLLKRPKRGSKWLALPFVLLFAAIGALIIFRSFASTPPTDPNDVLRGGFSTASEQAARAEAVQKLNSTAPENKGAKELYAYYGITDKEVMAAKLVAGFNPHSSPYDNWMSYGRTQRPNSVGLTIGGATFWAKPVKVAWAAGTTMTQPVLRGTTKDGRTFLIHAECGNLVMPNLTPFKATPHATIVKTAVSPAAGANVKPGDIIKYRLTATSDGNTEAYVKIADAIPLGTTFVSGVVETGNALPLPKDVKNGQTFYYWANYNLSKGDKINILVTVKVNPDTKSGFCNVAYITWFKGQTLPGKSNNVCHNLGSPVLKVDKSAVDVTAGAVIKVGDVITYRVTGSNVGVADSTKAAIWDQVNPDGWFEFVGMGGLTRAGKPVPASEIDATVSGKPNGGFIYYGYTLKTLKKGDSVSFTIKMRVKEAIKPAARVCNVAIIADSRPSPFGVWGVDEVCHAINGVNKHKSAIFVDRKGADGKPLPADGKTVAKAGDEIEYTLKTKNLGTTTLKAYEVREDLNDVLEYADVTVKGGGTMTNGIMTWKADILPGKTLVNKFTIKVKTPVPNLSGKTSSPGSYDYKMVNIYGDTVEIPLDKPILETIIGVLPQTGAVGFVMIPLIVLAGLMLAYSSGWLGKGSHRAQKSSNSGAAVAEPPHKPGDQFHPGGQVQKGHKNSRDS